MYNYVSLPLWTGLKKTSDAFVLNILVKNRKFKGEPHPKWPTVKVRRPVFIDSSICNHIYFNYKTIKMSYLTVKIFKCVVVSFFYSAIIPMNTKCSDNALKITSFILIINIRSLKF